MALPVLLQRVVDEMDSQNDLVTAFINKKTGELTIMTEEDYSVLQDLDDGGSIEELPAWQQEIIPKLRETDESDDFIPLPSQYEIHEYRIMENFIHSLDDGSVKDDLFQAIRGRGAFRMFKDRIIRHGVRDDWFAFKKQALKSIAIDFLDSEGIPWRDEEY